MPFASMVGSRPPVANLEAPIALALVASANFYLAPLDLGLQGNLNSRNWRMPLVKFAVRRIPEEYRLYGHFVIDTSLSRQDEILALLSDRDMRRIGVELGVIHGLDYPMPSNMHYGLSGFALNLIELPPEPTFTSERGHKIWVQPLSENDF
jgi:hypothetical protein